MAKKTLIIVIFDILFCLILFGGYDYYVQYKIGYSEVYVASHNIPQRKKLEKEDLEIIKVPKAFISDDVVLNLDDILGKYVKLSYSIPKGSLIYKGNIEDNIKDLADTLLIEGQVNYDLYTSDVKINTGHLAKNMYIDIYLTIDKKDKVISDLILEDCRITGFYDLNGNEILDFDKNSRISIVSLAINSEDVSLLNKAMMIGTLNCVVKNNTYLDNGTSKQKSESVLFDYLN